jgi:hypothetical protein
VRTRVIPKIRINSLKSRAMKCGPLSEMIWVLPQGISPWPCSDCSNPNKVRPISGGSKSCALNSLDMALPLDDQVHAHAPKVRKNLIKETRHPNQPATAGSSDRLPRRQRARASHRLLEDPVKFARPRSCSQSQLWVKAQIRSYTVLSLPYMESSIKPVKASLASLQEPAPS